MHKKQENKPNQNKTKQTKPTNKNKNKTNKQSRNKHTYTNSYLLIDQVSAEFILFCFLCCFVLFCFVLFCLFFLWQNRYLVIQLFYQMFIFIHCTTTVHGLLSLQWSYWCYLKLKIIQGYLNNWFVNFLRARYTGVFREFNTYFVSLFLRYFFLYPVVEYGIWVSLLNYSAILCVCLFLWLVCFNFTDFVELNVLANLTTTMSKWKHFYYNISQQMLQSHELINFAHCQ